MKIFKPHWVNHESKFIFSLDIHPDGTRVATGGQGNDCGRVVIWNMDPIRDELKETDPAVPKVLCQMDNHLECVNCVRWCLDGTMLATGGDDKIIMIWKRSKGAGSSSFGGFAKNHENWRCVHTLQGHGGDVLDLAWSPGDRWLASSSVDNSIFIWGDIGVSGTPPTVISILKGHTGLVKGVAWDPVGKYVASQSDDRTVRIWKTSDWTCDATITAPFVKCGGTTHVLRLSWCPDGQYLVSAHAMNGEGPTSQIIDREGWKCDKDFVGHRKAVTCTRFNDSIMKRTSPKTSKTQQYCCLAIGSRDKSLSVWMTALQRPLVVIHDIFEDSVLDLSWSADAYNLMACSLDGTVVLIQFEKDDLGTPLSAEEKNSLYQRIYGKGMYDLNVSSEKDIVIENAELLNSSSSGFPSTPGAQAKKLIPAFLPPPTPKVSQEDYTRIASRMDQQSNSNLTSSSSLSSMAVATSSPAKQAIHKQIETRTKDGKRRITPMFIPISQDADAEEQLPVIRSTLTGGATDNTQAVVSTALRVSENVVSEPRTVECQGRLDSRLAKLPLDPAPAKTNSSLIPAGQGNEVARTTGEQKLPVTANRGLMFNSSSRPETFNAGLTRMVGTKRIVVQNNFQKATANVPTAVHRVACYEGNQKNTAPRADDQPLWQLVTGSAVCNFSTSERYVVVGCLDATVYIVDVTYGALQLPVITMASPVAQSSFSLREENAAAKDLVGIVTESGVVRIWDMDAKKTELAVTCQGLLPSGQSTGISSSISMFAIANGTPFIVLGNCTSYCYARDLDSWLVLSGKDLLQQRAMIRCTPAPSAAVVKDMKRYPLTSIQTTVLGMMPAAIVRAANGQSHLNGVAPTQWESLAQLTFIENQLRLCEAIRSPTELKYWYSHLGNSLARFGSETRLRHLLDDLLGPVFSGNPDGQKLRTILGVQKLELLEIVLGQLKEHTRWQRISIEYGDQLVDLQKRTNIKITSST